MLSGICNPAAWSFGFVIRLISRCSADAQRDLQSRCMEFRIFNPINQLVLSGCLAGFAIPLHGVPDF